VRIFTSLDCATWCSDCWKFWKISSLLKWLQTLTMGWLRLVGSLKWKVSFAKEPYKRDYILQKRPIIVRRLLMVGTSYRAGFLGISEKWARCSNYYRNWLFGKLWYLQHALCCPLTALLLCGSFILVFRVAVCLLCGSFILLFGVAVCCTVL